MIIDSNVYWLPEELFTSETLANQFLRSVPREYDVYAHKLVSSDGRKEFVIEKPEGSANLNYFSGDYALEKQLRDLDEANVEKVVLKLPGCAEWLTLDLCKKFNNLMAERVRQSKGHMEALAVVPPRADADVLKELTRCVTELHMKGVQLAAHYGNKYLDDPMFRPLLKKINDLNVPVYVHHTPVPTEYTALLDYNNLRRSYGRCEDQTIAVSRELFSGMFEELPNLKMIHSMLGGGFFAYTNMFFPTDSGNGRFNTNNEKIKKYLNKNIYFEMSHAQPWGVAQLECAVKVLGADHIIYGSSYPVKKSWLTEGPTYVESLNISGADKNKILSGNAVNIYNL
ncbi:amidohydrolase family protein [Pediococcus siamensis]|uniref:amidohydrolase family protein n=1 Tax=Pediococcus siamensis TaxID=381829 RepID=UPI0039A326B3